MTHSLTLGSLLLTDPLPDNDHGYVFSVLADGAGFGVAQGVREIVTSLMADGDLVRTTRFGNREVSFAVQIEGPTLSALAHGEAALRREVGRGNTLTWQAPDVLSVPTVFEVVDSEMSQTFDDLDELRRRRTFVLTLTCAPFARSADPVTVDAMVSGTTTVAVDTCDSKTAWSGTRSGAFTGVALSSEGVDPPADTAVEVYEFDEAVTTPETWTLTRTGAVDFTATPFLVVELKTQATSDGLPLQDVTISAQTSGGLVTLPVVQATRTADNSGYYRLVADATAAPSASAITFTYRSMAGYHWQYLGVRNVDRTDISPNITTRQQSRIVEVGGTERTPASIHVSDSTVAGSLGGLVIVHTSPEDGSGYSPPLRRWRTADSTGPETVDAGMLSGKREPVAFVAGGFVAEVPTSALPEGGYVLMARMRMAVDPEPVNVAWSTSTIFPDTTTQQGYTNGSAAVAFATTAWHLVPLAALSLPSVRTKAGKVQIVIQVPTVDHAQVELDEAWLFRADDDCALTIVRSFLPDLWLDSPDVSSSVPRVWIGDGRDLQVHPGDALDAIGNHVLSPEGTAVFTAALTDYPATEATFYRRWHSNAAE